MAPGDSALWSRVFEIGRWAAGVAVTALIAAIVNYWFRKISAQRAALAGEAPLTKEPPPVWRPEWLARTFLAKDLLGGFDVVAGTRLIILDGGVRQPIELMPGDYKGREVAQRFRRFNVTPGALVLQFTSIPSQVSTRIDGLRTKDRLDVRADFSLSVSVDEQTAERLADWHVSKDGAVRASEVAAEVRQHLQPWLEERAAETDAADLLASPTSIGTAALAHIRGTILESHGLTGRLHSLVFSSEAFEGRKNVKAQGTDRIVTAVASGTAVEDETLGRVASLLDDLEAQRVVGRLDSALRFIDVVRQMQHEQWLRDALRATEKAEQVRVLHQGLGARVRWFPDDTDRFAARMLAELKTRRGQGAHEQARQALLHIMESLKASGDPFPVELWIGARASARGTDLHPTYSAGSLKIGVPFDLHVRSPKAGHLSVFCIGTARDVTMLRPNQWSQATFVAAEAVVDLPGAGERYKLISRGPAGTEVVQAFVTEQPLGVANGFQPGGPTFKTSDLGASALPRTIYAVAAEEIQRMPSGTWGTGAIACEVS